MTPKQRKRLFKNAPKRPAIRNRRRAGGLRNRCAKHSTAMARLSGATIFNAIWLSVGLGKMNKQLVLFLLGSALYVSAYSQSSVLLEACNSIQVPEKRLLCLKELMKASGGATAPEDTSVSALKDAFASIEGAVSSGLNYSRYQDIALESAKSLSVFKSKNKTASVQALASLDLAVKAYQDGVVVWQANIYDSKDAGIFFGKILDASRGELPEITSRYQLHTTSVLGHTHLPAEAALSKIWAAAGVYSKRGLEMLTKDVEQLKPLPPAFPPPLQSQPLAGSGQVSSPDLNFCRRATAVDRDGVSWARPIDGLISFAYSADRRGIEFRAKSQAEVRAVAQGVVVFAGNGLNGYKNLVILKHHNGYLSVYANNTRIEVIEGQYVKQCDYIADSDGSLIFELRKGSAPVDPTPFISG